LTSTENQIWQCPICTSLESYHLSVNSEQKGILRDVAVCVTCGFAAPLIQSKISENIENQKLFFDNDVVIHRNSDVKWPHRPALIAREIERMAGSKGRVLDIGCNTGLNLKAFKKKWQKFGVELSQKAADIARQFTDANIFCGPIEDYEKPSDYFDVIISFAVIEHLSDPVSFVRWCYNHVKPGGLIVLMTGDRESQVALDMGGSWILYSPKEHVSYFSARSLCRLLSDTGFTIKRQEWRFMYKADGMGSSGYRHFQKIKEILRLVTVPIFDHYYVYARKPYMN
jgi:2-polyprenyl-3-methyl-5-hydroxy-6-metoxy-1,4-benzoquinol methylase